MRTPSSAPELSPASVAQRRSGPIQIAAMETGATECATDPRRAWLGRHGGRAPALNHETCPKQSAQARVGGRQRVSRMVVRTWLALVLVEKRVRSDYFSGRPPARPFTLRLESVPAGHGKTCGTCRARQGRGRLAHDLQSDPKRWEPKTPPEGSKNLLGESQFGLSAGLLLCAPRIPGWFAR